MDSLPIQKPGTRKSAKPPKPEPYCAKTVIEDMLGDEAAVCIAWAETRQVLTRPDPPDRCQRDAEHIIEKWRKATATKAMWKDRIPTDIPHFKSETPITIGTLHAHLTKLLALHPTIADVVVEYEQCCGWFEACDVFFHDEKGLLRIS